LCNLLTASDIAILIVPDIFIMTATAGKVMYTSAARDRKRR
jgi:hypothetical protein